MIWFSIWIGIKRTFSTPGGAIGWLTASVSLFNLFTALFTIPISAVLHQVLHYYRAVLHTVIEFLILPFSIDFSPITKDLIVLYAVMGGILTRFMELDETRLEMHRNWKHDWKFAIKDLYKASGFYDKYVRLVFFPTPIRQGFVFSLWWSFLSPLVFYDPYIIYEKRLVKGRMRWVPSGTYLFDGRPTEGRFHDKRIVYFTTIFLTLVGMFLFFALNAFTVPRIGDV